MNPLPTIAAISTAPAQGAIAIIRLSGPAAMQIVGKVWKGKDLSDIRPRQATLGYIIEPDGSIIDQVLITYFKAPASFTGEDMVEIACHGSIYLQHKLLAHIIDAGAKPAGPGEFSMRAVINSKMDLAQAEGVADLIASTSRASAQMAMRQMNGGISRRLKELTEQLKHLAALIELELDFSEEDVEFASRKELNSSAETISMHLHKLIESYSAGTAIKQGIPIAIIGAPNAGKSSLLNALLDDNRAIVSDIAGTTRDTIEENLTIGNYNFRITDTAGLRNTEDPIEKAGIAKTHEAVKRSRIILHVIDSTQPAKTIQPNSATTIYLINKTDLDKSNAQQWIDSLTSQNIDKAKCVAISTLSESDISMLKNELLKIAEQMQEEAGEQIITSERHRASLIEAYESIERVKDTLNRQLPLDMLTQDIRQSIESLGAITGSPITPPTLLHHIFSHFCIGK